MRKQKLTTETPLALNRVVMRGDYFRLPMTKGYTKRASEIAMQVMECWGNVMTVKCKGGCMTKEYNEFEKVTDLSVCREIHNAPYYEDNRRK